MAAYVIRRVLYMFVTLIVVSIVGFFIIELPPGSYLDVKIQQLTAQGGEMSDQQISTLKARYGLDDPSYVRFWKWISGFVRGDFGQSFEYEVPVSQLIWGRLAFTVLISVLTLIVSWGIAIVVGVYSATHRQTALDYTFTAAQFLGLAMPGFLLALIIMVFAQRALGIQVGGLLSQQYTDAPWSMAKIVDLGKHIWIPVLITAVNGTAWLSRVMRSNLLDVLNMQYVQTARAKGVAENTVVWKHAVRNALHPLVMVLGMTLPQIISGQTVIALVLNLPTDGPLFFHALIQKDMYLAGTFLMFLTILLLIGNLLADILLAWLDPRIRLE